MKAIKISFIPLSELVVLKDERDPAAVFHLEARSDGLYTATSTSSRIPVEDGWWAVPRDNVGDAPDKYHPKYIMAVLSSRVKLETGGKVVDDRQPLPEQWLLPAIAFQTDEWTRRSMTLNGMRMATEYVSSGSRRVLQLVEQRLQVGQSDVVHDVLVYLMNQILDARRDTEENRLLRAEAVAAFLGVNRVPVEELFLQRELDATAIAQRIEAGYAGPVRRPLHVLSMIENQVELLDPAMAENHREEEKLLWLIDEVLDRLCNDANSAVTNDSRSTSSTSESRD